MRRAYLDEAVCPACHGLAPVFRDHESCLSCSSLEESKVPTNTTRQLRTDVARHFCNLGVMEDVFDIPTEDILVEVQGTTPSMSSQQTDNQIRLLSPVWPYDRSTAEWRHRNAISDFLPFYKEMASCHTSVRIGVGTQVPVSKDVRLYTDAGRQVLEHAARLLSYDTGLSRQDIASVMKLLVPLLRHPADHAQYSWPSEQVLDLEGCQTMILAYCHCFPSPGSAIRAIKSTAQLLHRWLAQLALKQQDQMNQRKRALMSARLAHYTIPLSADDDTLDGWECAICGEDRTNNPLISTLDVCGHTFHFGCMEAWMLQRALGNTTCPLCRRTFDRMD